MINKGIAQGARTPRSPGSGSTLEAFLRYLFKGETKLTTSGYGMHVDVILSEELREGMDLAQLPEVHGLANEPDYGEFASLF